MSDTDLKPYEIDKLVKLVNEYLASERHFLPYKYNAIQVYIRELKDKRGWE